MKKVIVYVDDAAHAQHILAPVLIRDAARETHWVLVACAPRMTHRVSKWLSHRARENWRTKWADKLFAQIQQQMCAVAVSQDRVSTVLARGPLPELTEQLRAKAQGPVQVIDARRLQGPADNTAAHENSAGVQGIRTSLGSFLTGCGTLWLLALE